MSADPHVLAIEARAKAANVKMTPILVGAGVAPTTWYRWRKAGIGPRLSTLRKVEEALSRHLGEAA